MLKREEAQRLLEQEGSKTWRDEACASIAREVHRGLRATAYALLDCDEHGQPLPHRTKAERERRQRIVDEAWDRMCVLESRQRLTIVGALLPGSASHVEGAWQLFSRLPYQTGYRRKAFRLRAADPTISAARTEWLQTLLTNVGAYRHKDVTWLAAWAPYLGHYGGGYAAREVGILCAAAIDGGGPEGEAVFEALTASARGEHPIGAMGRHVTTGLLVASQPDGWAFIERLLLAAQREEGLRQVIMETVDEAHPEAFRRLLKLILDQDLIRFSATIRAADVWFGFGWDVDDARSVREALGEVRTLLDAPQARAAALAPLPEASPRETEPAPATVAPRAARKKADDLASSEARAAAQRLYLALWTVAFEDALAAVKAAGPLLGDADPLRRLAVVYLLGQLGLPRAQAALVPLLDDPDLHVALCAFQALSRAAAKLAHDLFERYERLLGRLDDNQEPCASGLWPWLTLRSGAEDVADALLRVLGERPPTRLLPHLQLMGAGGQIAAAKLLAAQPEWDAPIRETLFRMAGDRSSYVRDEALKLISSRPITHQEAVPLEHMLTRKSGETRRALLTMLLKQPDDAALASAGRLLVARHPLQRVAGLDLLRELATAGRAIPACQQAARGYQEARQTLSPDEQTLLTAILDAGRPAQEVPTLANALGLIDRADLTPLMTPRRLAVRVDTPAARACLVLLDELIEQQSTTPVIVKGWQGSDEQLLGNIQWFAGPDASVPAQEDQANLPLAELWLQWDRQRPAASRDDDGLELVRALLLLCNARAGQGDAAPAQTDREGAPISTFLNLVANSALAGLASVQGLLTGGSFTATGGQPDTTAWQARLRRPHLVNAIVGWLVRLEEPSPAGAVDLLLDSLETALALIPPRQFKEWVAAQDTAEWWLYGRGDPRRDGSLDLLSQHLAEHPSSWTAAHHVRYWRLLHWLDQPWPGAPRHLPALEVVLRAHRAGEASEADILEHLVAGATRRHHYYGGAGLQDLQLLSARTAHPLLEQYPILQRLVPLLRARILEIELARGEMPTPATALALSLRYAGGLPIFVRLLGALASGDLVRGYLAASDSRTGALSHLLRSTYPAPGDTYEAFAHGIAEAGIEPGRLVAAAVYAPQWARYVEQTLVWPRLEEAVWWIHAHTKDNDWTVDAALREAWQAQVAERTPLSGQDLMDGAVDVEWFWRSYADLGAEHWNEIYAAAKYASSGGGHAWARLSADSMTGAVDSVELLRRITSKRNQGAVRALGLLPLPEGAAAREGAVRERYQAIQEFRRTSKQFGAQRRASEELAARIGLENLARTAGYPDPIRLQWAMEAELAADLRDGAVVVEDGNVQVTLSLNALSTEPEIAVSKNGSRLKALPARLKNNEAITALYTRKREIERQVARMRRSLEDAMCRGDHFTAAEIAGLLQHPVLSRLLRNLVFIEDNTADGQPDHILGYPVPGTGLALAGMGVSRATLRPAPAPSPARPQPEREEAGWRTFTYKDAKSDKFWRIRVDGAAFAVNYGRAGTDGQHQRKEVAGNAEAQREAEKLIREKRAKGYVETTASGAPDAAHAASVPVPAIHEAGEGDQPVPVPPTADRPLPVAVPDEQETSPDEGAALLQFRAHDGTTRAVAGTTTLRLAHPHDLLRSGAWHAWQHDCFASERIQPFKQVFRELYVLTPNELRVGDEAASYRYSGQQVQPRQALALFGQRGWISDPEQGLRRTFHDAQLTACVDFDSSFLTPAEVEGLTIDRVSFARRGSWQPLPLVEVPPRTFSEAMRDLDLVVSVAHRGGVDPEASASTVEMRAALVQETCTLLHLRNVSLKSAHALIDGTLGSYSVHLGSAIVHRQPGGALCIVPVHSQHRGRLFLPFADDDPRTAEVVSKVILLARDGEIKDPSILEQIL